MSGEGRQDRPRSEEAPRSGGSSGGGAEDFDDDIPF